MAKEHQMRIMKVLHVGNIADLAWDKKLREEFNEAELILCDGKVVKDVFGVNATAK
jgi:hypothetical protein